MSGLPLSTDTKTTRVLVDTNVWLDAFLGFRTGCKAAVELLKEGQGAGVEFVYPVGALQDVFALLITELKRKARLEGAEIDSTAIPLFEEWRGPA